MPDPRGRCVTARSGEVALVGCACTRGPPADMLLYSPDFDQFLINIKTALDQHMLPERARLIGVFSDDPSVAHPACKGSWLEFGVHTGGEWLLRSESFLVLWQP